MAQGLGGGTDGLGLQLQAAREMDPGLEVQQLKASVRARLFGIVDTPPTLGGYTIVRPIGRGGMGAVYEARDERGEVVALKTLRGCEPGALYRFKHEFRALSDLTHPNLALLYSLVVAGDQAFLTMERIDGVDFLAHVHAGGGGAVRVREALAQLVDGLAALHAAGKLHRDVKPSNVLVTREGRVVILDFGLVQELTPTAGGPGDPVAGTPAYMAPELLTGGGPSTASDWYSVGVMLYEALTGALPFAGGSFEVLRDKCERDPPPPQLRAPAADPALSRLCTQLLARDPAARPDRRAIVAALTAAGAGVGGRARQGGAAGGAIGGAIGAATELVAQAVARGSTGLSERTGHMSPKTGPSTGPRAPLIGRQHELDALRKALAGVQAGQPAVALVRGGSGVGKTALIQAFLEQIGGRAVVLSGRCYEREQVPHNAFDSLVDALTGHLLALPEADRAAALAGDVAALARLFPVLRRVPEVLRASPPGAASGPPDQRWRERAYAAFKGLLRWLGAQVPVALHIDDLQWADADSATLLAELVAAPAPAVLLLASYRATGTGPSPVVQGLLQRLRGGGARVWELAVEPLTLAEAQRLAHALLGGGPAADSAAVVARESGGVPLFVHELVHDVLVSISSGSAAGPTRLEDLIAARAGRLPPSARELLELLTVAARPVSGDVVLGLLDRPAAVRGALHQLSVARFVRAGRSERGELIEVYHDRIRETVLAGLDAARQRACHRTLARALLALPADERGEPEILAHHLHAAGDPDGARQHMALAALRAGEAMAFARAAELALATVRLLPAGDLAGRRALRVDAAQALLHAGSYADAAGCFLAAAEGAPQVQALRLRQRAAEALLNCGALDRGRALLQEVLRQLGHPMPRGRLLRAARVAGRELALRRRGLEFAPRAEADVPEATLLWLDTLRAARLAVVNVDPTTARMYQLEYLAQCLEVGEPGRIVQAVAGHAAYVSHAGAGGSLAAARLLDQARAIGERHAIAGGDRYVALCAAIVAFNRGAWEDALTELDAALPPAATEPPGDARRPAGVAVLCGLCGLWALNSCFFLGDLVAMAARRERYVAVIRAAGDRASEARVAVGMQVFTALAADDPTRAAQDLATALQRWPRGGYVLERGHAFLAARAIDVYTGDGARAWARLVDGWPAFTRSYLYQGQHGRVLGEFWRGAAALLAAQALRGASGERLRDVAEAAARQIHGERARWADPLGHLLRAGVAVQRRRAGQAHAALAVAVAGFDAAGMRLWAAAARHQAGRLAGDEGRCAAQERLLRAQGVVAPARMVAALVPGFGGA